MGTLEPLVVRNKPGTPHQYEIIAGERRWRAARLAGEKTVPIINRGAVPDEVALRMALIENIQRRDLDPIEEAEAYRKLNTSWA